jgi:hypothetical protein
MEKQQTAVKWLIDTINKINHDYEMGIIDETLWSIQTYEAHKKAKEMGKEQILDAHYFGYTDCRSHNMRTEEEYYNETFKSE